MEVLIQGRDFTSQLQLLLLQNMTSLFGDGVFEESALDLTTKIHQSFTDALSLVNTSTSPNYHSRDGSGTILSSDEVLIRESTLSPVLTGINSFSNSDHWKSSGDSKAIPGSGTDPKVGFKRRKTTHTWVKVTPTPVDDGHAWRKYGQKVIQDNAFPRSYYRCTHRKEQDCFATKQVQKTQEKPSIYQTTYIGHHTCKDTASLLDAIPDLMLDESDQNNSACVINFQTNLMTTKQPYTFSSSSFNKHESIKHNATIHEQNPLKSTITPSDHHQHLFKNTASTDHDDDLTMSEFPLLADLSAFDSICREVLEVLGVQHTSL